MIHFADLHIHSRYSRATSGECNLVELSRWAALKGIRVLATGDFTHPAWRSEIREQLEEAEPGLLRMKEQFVPDLELLPDGFHPRDVRFMLNVEISSIYKKRGATRKVHNLVFMPDMDAMDRFSARLERIGNIASDGRPILGLDSRNLLEIALETTAESFVIPAHVWTPWFSILGSKSGFDSVEECFDDLTPHIFALETGLSSDPEMNHRVESLDRYTLVSNSDSHSPSRLGREVNIFRGELSYYALREALRRGGRPDAATEPHVLAEQPDRASETSSAEFLGTIEFFPEEGKYHLDGHRKCSARMEPEDTEKYQGRCPVCGHPVTVGVVNRVMELAGRAPGTAPLRAAPFWKMLPLQELIGQALDVGPQSRKVQAAYQEMLQKLGPELTILWQRPLEAIEQVTSPILVEAVRRVRSGEVAIDAGYDGEYGTVRLFGPGERDRFAGQESLVPEDGSPRRRGPRQQRTTKRGRPKKAAEDEVTTPSDPGLNQEQEHAASVTDRPVLVQAGPGTGKTRTLCHRVAELIKSGAVQPQEITVVTFTRKAARELQERLAALLAGHAEQPCWVGTFHQLGIRIMDFYRESGSALPWEKVLEREDALTLFKDAMKHAGLKKAAGQLSTLWEGVGLLKQLLVEPDVTTPDDEVSSAYRAYEERLRQEGALDLDDLLVEPLRLMKEQPEIGSDFAQRFCRHLLVDEFQDVNRAQYEMVRVLAPEDGTGLFLIGDPDQAIYGFRGSDLRFFGQFAEDYPHACPVRLKTNYRSQGTVLEAAQAALGSSEDGCLVPHIPATAKVRLVRLPNPKTEGEFICRSIEALIGGSSFLAIDLGKASARAQEMSFRDFAVLYRLNAVGDALEEAFSASGIPYQRATRSDPKEEAEALDPRVEAVTLMTIHAAKGLEFPVVFLAGCDDGIIPYTILEDTKECAADVDEERRLLYVAMTRAGRELILTHSAKRSLFGRSYESPPSRFLAGLKASLLEKSEPLKPRPGGFVKKPTQCELF